MTPFKCNACNAKFSQTRDLNRRIESVHEGKKCNDCNAEFSQKRDLNKHTGYQFMKKKSHSNVMTVMQNFLKQEM